MQGPKNVPVSKQQEIFRKPPCNTQRHRRVHTFPEVQRRMWKYWIGSPPVRSRSVATAAATAAAAPQKMRRALHGAHISPRNGISDFIDDAYASSWD